MCIFCRALAPSSPCTFACPWGARLWGGSPLWQDGFPPYCVLGAALLDLEQTTLPGIAHLVVETMIVSDQIRPEDRASVLRTLLLKHRCAGLGKRALSASAGSGAFSLLRDFSLKRHTECDPLLIQPYHLSIALTNRKLSYFKEKGWRLWSSTSHLL